MWGFYPDASNPHRLGFVTVTWPCEYTYWVEPEWMGGYERLATACQAFGGSLPAPEPVPPASLIVPAGPGRPDSWDAARHERAKVACWQLTQGCWSGARSWLLDNGEIEV